MKHPRRRPLLADHNCNQGPHLASLEDAIRGIHEALKQLTDLMTAKAESDTKLTGVIKTTDDYEIRIRSLEAKSSAPQWVFFLAQRIA